MFKVVCISDDEQLSNELSRVVKGNIYTVISTHTLRKDFFNENNTKSESGIYYVLIECGDTTGFHSSMFVTINEQDIEETEFERNYNTEKQLN